MFILCDDLGINDLACYGRTDHRTPHLDRLAAQGTRFTSAYCAQPICSPSRAAILTGKTPARLHLTTYLPGPARSRIAEAAASGDRRCRCRSSEKTLAEHFKEAGYATAAHRQVARRRRRIRAAGAGLRLLLRRPGQHGPPRTEGGKGEYDLTAAAERFIEENRDRPFFVYLAHNTPHIPYAAQRRRIEKNAGAFEPVYAAVIETLDDTVGRLLAKLERCNWPSKTIVVFTSDNGGLHVPEGPHPRITHNTPYRAGKGFVYEGGLRIPLIVRWPGHVPASRVVDAPVVNTDWVPTLLELAGQPVPAGLDGTSFARSCCGRGPAPERRFFWHFPHYNNQGGRPTGAMRDGNWMLVEYYDGAATELYNIASDIGEQNNVAAQHCAAGGRTEYRSGRMASGRCGPDQSSQPGLRPAQVSGTL